MRRRSQSSAPVPPKDIDANDASNRLVGHFGRANPGQFSRVPKRSGVQSSLILQLIAVSLVRIIPSECRLVPLDLSNGGIQAGWK